MPQITQSGTVYVWYPHGEQVGHVGMHIGQHEEADSTDWYVSWWPAGDDLLKTASEPYTHNGDLDGEGGAPHVVYRIFGGDVAAMKSCWDATRTKPNSHYLVFRKSCATIVARILKAGGHEKNLGTFQKLMFTENHVWTPKNVAQWCNALRDKGLATKTKSEGCPTKAQSGFAMRLMGLR